MKPKPREKKQPTRNTRTSSTWPVSYRWLAVGTLAIYTAIGGRIVNIASAQQLPQQSADASRLPQTLQFNIAPGTLETVLPAFEHATQLHVIVPDAKMASLASPGSLGGVPARGRAGTNSEGHGPELQGQRRQDFHAGSQSRLDVCRCHSERRFGRRLDAKIRRAPTRYPQTVSTVSQEVVSEQNATTLRDTLRNVAGISLAAGEGSSQGDSLTIRGFTARTDLFIDGMRDYGNYYRDPFDMQEVEVLQGPSSMEFGRGSTGGVVNQETKTPQLNRFISGDLDVGTDLTRRLTLDVNTPVPQLGSHTAFRLNVMGDEGNIAGRDVAENRRFGAAPTLEFGVGTPTRLTFSYFHQDADDIPDYGVPWLYNAPAPVPHDNYYGFAKGNFLRTYDDMGTIKAEHDFNRHFTIRNQVRYANYVRDVQITEPQLYQPGTTTPYPVGTPLSAMVVTRNELAANSTETNFEDQLDLTAKFATGFLHHTVVTGVEVGSETSDPIRPKFTNVPTTSLLDPNPDQTFSGTETISSIVHTRANTIAAYALDTIQIASKWQLIGGLRRDRFAAHYTQAVPPASAFNELNKVPTWRAGLVQILSGPGAYTFRREHHSTHPPKCFLRPRLRVFLPRKTELSKGARSGTC